MEAVGAEHLRGALRELRTEEVTQRHGVAPGLDDGDRLGGGEVAATPAQATALELLEQLAGEDEDELKS